MIIEQGSTQSKLVKIFKRNLFANLGRKLPEPIGDIKIPIEVSNRNNAPILQASPVQTPNMPGKTDLSKKIFQNIGFLKNSDVTKFGVGDVKNILSVPLLDSKTDTIQLPSNVDLTKFNLPNINLPKTDSLVQSSVATISNLSTEPLINSKIDELRQPLNLDLLKSKVNDIIIKPFGTILSFHSIFGDIFVKPQRALLDLFDKIAEPHIITINQSRGLVNSPIDTIVDTIPNSKILELTAPAANTEEIKSTTVLTFLPENTQLISPSSVLSFNVPGNGTIDITSVSEHIGNPGNIAEISTSSVLKFFQSTLNLNSISVLNLETANSRIKDFRTESVLTRDTKNIGNLVVKDIETVLKTYQVSGIAGSIPTPVGSFTLNSPIGITHIDVTKIPMRIQPEPFIENAGQGISNLEDQLAILSTVLQSNEFVTNKTFVTNSPLRVTNLNTEKIVTQIPDAKLGTTDGFKITDAASDFNRTRFHESQLPDLNAFNFKQRTGVINQFANYYPNNIAPNTANGELSFITYVDYQIRKTIGVSISRPTDFNTPLFPINNISQITGNREYYSLPIEYRAYTDASEKVPSIANAFQDVFTGAMATVAGGLMNSVTYDGLQSILGVDFTPLRQSAVGIAPIAGDIYFRKSGLDSEIQAITLGNTSFAPGNSLFSTISSVARVAVSLTSAFIPNDVFKNDAPEYALMIAQILAGTKYTSAYAFYDPQAVSYSSKYPAVGENAVNWYYNDGKSEQTNEDKTKYESTDAKAVDEQFRLSILQRFQRGLSVNDTSNDFNNTLSNFQQTTNVITNVIRNASNVNIFGLNTPNTINRDGIPLLGKEYQNLKVPSLLADKSFTFGSFKEFFADLKYGYWGGHRTAAGDGLLNSSLPSSGPLDKNNLDAGPLSPDINYSNTPENDFESFTKNSPLSTNEVIDTSLRTFQNGSVPRPTTLNGQLTYPLGGYTQKLKDTLANASIKRYTAAELGIPNKEENNYVDVKNASELFVVDKESDFIDNDLIDFYFEDITSDPMGRPILLPFRAIITSYSDNTSTDWQTHTYVGRPDKFYVYGGFDRRLGIAFDVVINSKSELLTSWRKLNYLQGLCYPTSYPGNVSMTAPLMAVTVGALLQRVFVVMNSISFDLDASTIWEIEKSGDSNFQLPMIVKVSVDFNVLFDSLPITNARHVAQKQNWIEPILFQYIPGDKISAGTAEGVSVIQKNPDRKRKLKSSSNGGVIITNG